MDPNVGLVNDKYNYHNRDLVLIVKNKEINVHKALLMRCSGYFSFELRSNRSNTITLHDTSIKPFVAVLRICYGNLIETRELYETTIKELLQAVVVANRYEFDDCERYLSRKLVELFVYQMSDQYFDEAIVIDEDPTVPATFDELINFSFNKRLSYLSYECENFINANPHLWTINAETRWDQPEE